MTELRVPWRRAVNLRIDSEVPYNTVYLLVEQLGTRSVSLIVEGGHGRVSIPIGQPNPLDDPLALTVMLLETATVIRHRPLPTNTGTTNIGEHVLGGRPPDKLREYLQEVKAKNQWSSVATLVASKELSYGSVVLMADAIRSAGFTDLRLGRARMPSTQ